MIIPVRCWTCGKVLANKYETYKKLVAEDKSTNDETIINVTNVKKTAEGKALDKLGIKRYCCRNVMLSHVELIDII
jgi:DNA-directed RNA polymerase subunit N (RpoN/RPB10)